MNLVLLKTNDLADEPDRYVEYFTKAKTKTRKIASIKQINLLEFNFINQTDFKVKVGNCFCGLKYSSLIVTSKQTIKALRGLDSIESNTNLDNKLIVYSVGNQTSKLFQELIDSKFPYLNDKFEIRSPSDKGRKQCAEELAKLIVEDNINEKNKFYGFYPCSSIRGDTLSKILNENSLFIDELFIYETIPSNEGIRNLKECLEQVRVNDIYSLIFFSPSIVEVAFENCLNKLDFDAKFGNHGHLVSIGPSTTRKLEFFTQKLKLNPIIIETSEPTPEALEKTLISIGMEDFPPSEF